MFFEHMKQMDNYNFLQHPVSDDAFQKCSCGIYFLQNMTGYIKIGKSADITRRISDYKTYATQPAWYAGLVPTGKQAENERLQHELWDDYRITGEWFAPVRDILFYLRSFDNGIGLPLERMPFSPVNKEELICIQRNARPFPVGSDEKASDNPSLNDVEIVRYAIKHLGGKLTGQDLFAHFQGQISFQDLIEWLKYLDGEVIEVDGVRYEVIPPRGSIGRGVRVKNNGDKKYRKEEKQFTLWRNL